MGKITTQIGRSQHRNKAGGYQKFKGNRKEGQGFADVRKSQAVSRYHRDLAKERKKLKSWSEKVQKLYAESDDSVDEHLTATSRQKTRICSTSDNVQNSQRHSTGRHIDSEDIVVDDASVTTVSSGKNDKRLKKNVKVPTFFKQQKEWQKKQEEKERRLKEIETQKQAKQEAILKHRREKIQRHKLLAKQNYKGQPNMASRMELLLSQIVKNQQHKQT